MSCTNESKYNGAYFDQYLQSLFLPRFRSVFRGQTHNNKDILTIKEKTENTQEFLINLNGF